MPAQLKSRFYGCPCPYTGRYTYEGLLSAIPSTGNSPLYLHKLPAPSCGLYHKPCNVIPRVTGLL